MALFFLTLWGSMADGHAPFLGAHMANDPNFSCGEVKLERCNCYFSPVFEVVLSKDVKANEEILIDYNRYLTK
jgi:hypothetical protein